MDMDAKSDVIQPRMARSASIFSMDPAIEFRPLKKWRAIQVYVIKAQAMLNVLRAVPMIILEEYSFLAFVLVTGVLLFYGKRGLMPIWKESYLWVYIVGMIIEIPIELAGFLLATGNADNHWSADVSSFNWIYYTYLVMCFMLMLLDGTGAYLTLRMVYFARSKPERTKPLLQKRRLSRGGTSKKKKHYKGTRVVNCNSYGPAPTVTSDGNTDGQSVEFVTNQVTKTQYNVFTFLPKFLMFQFSRLANLYTLCIVFLSTFDFSPIDPVSSLFPLACVLTAAAAKEINEDRKRKKNDDEINNRQVEVLRNGGWSMTAWKDVVVTDIVKVKDKDFFPSDLLLLSSTREKGTCYVETANLDGESNLKLRTADEATAEFVSTDSLANFQAYVECEQPNPHLYKFDGTLHLSRPGQDELVNRISVDAILLRGCVLRNTEHVFGLVLNTGTDTKVEQNATDTALKQSGVEKRVNDMLIWMFFMQMFICVYCSLSNGNWTLADNAPYNVPWYIYDYSGESSDYIFLSYIILYNTLIPLSMYVSMEVIRFANARWVDEDTYMQDENGKFSACRNSSIIEDLGQVRYVFSDKTGTLTCNEMVFVATHIGDVRYGTLEGVGFNAPDFATDWQAQTKADDMEQARRISKQVMCLAVCHTVQPESHDNESKSDERSYQAESPDELAFVLAAAQQGVEVYDRTASSLTLRIRSDSPVLTASDDFDGVKGTPSGADHALYVYELLQVLPFNNVRKRMSILVKTPSGQTKLYIKGADDGLKPILHADGRDFWESVDKSLSFFAHRGLRTLVMGEKVLDEKTYTNWCERKDETMLILDPSVFQPKFDALINEMESSIMLSGCSAVEDRLQEGVPDTITALRTAGVKVWVLTGDKQETAISIGYSSAVINDEMRLIIFDETHRDPLIDKLIALTHEFGLDGATTTDEEAFAKKHQPISIVINGPALGLVLSPTDPNPKIEAMFLSLAKLCTSVICCRCAPLQKSAVVRLVSERGVLFGDGAITLAIGDGANDVSMIQEAHIGIGISGKEGMQAVLASDFALPQFKFLQRLMLVHGYYTYRRISKVILYCFCKNFALAITAFWFSFVSKFSGQLIFFDLCFTMYNALFTALPILSIGLNDVDIESWILHDTIEGQKIYKTGMRGEALNNGTFGGYVSLGVWHSFWLFWFGFYGMSDTLPNGQMLGLWELGSVSFTCLVLAMSIQVSLLARSWERGMYVTLIISLITFWGFIFLYCTLSYDLSWLLQTDAYWSFHHVVSSGVFWLVIIIAPLVGVFPNVLWKVTRVFFCPTESYRLALKSRAYWEAYDRGELDKGSLLGSPGHGAPVRPFDSSASELGDMKIVY